MRNISSRSGMYIIVFLFISVLPLNSAATQTIFTIQTGSFQDIKTAQSQFDSLVQTFGEKQLDYLRIEKIGNFHCVRNGKFEDRAAAEALLPQIKTLFPTAIVMDAYFIEARIENLYKSPTKGISQAEKRPQPIPEKTKPQAAEKPLKEAEKKLATEPLEKQLKAISELVDKKDYEKALEVIKTEIAVRPENPEINGWYGAVLLKMNRPSDAITYLQKAAELSPQVSDYHNGVGYCFFYLNKFNEAENEFNKAVDLDPSNIDALAGLGVTYTKIGRKDKAMDIYTRLKTLDADTANKLLKIIEGKTS